MYLAHRGRIPCIWSYKRSIRRTRGTGCADACIWSSFLILSEIADLMVAFGPFAYE